MPARTRMRLILTTIILFSVLSPAFGGIVNVDRMLREHRIYVATNEDPTELNKYWLDWRPMNATVMPISELFLNRSRLADGGFVIWIIDRSRGRMIPEEEELLPSPLSSIAPGEVLVYASKTGNKRSPFRHGRWDVLITAPDRKWLHYELDRLGKSGILDRAVGERGTVLDRYSVKRMCIISNEGRQVAEDWVARQTSPGKSAIDWDFIPAESWTPESDPGMDTVCILNRDNLNEKSAKVAALLPEPLRAWLTSDTAHDECAAAKQTVSGASGQARTVAAVVGPCTRHLKSILDRYSSLGKIPEALSTSRLTDLSPYPRVVVVVRPGDREFDGQGGLLDDFAGKITAALSSAELGFRCESRQDLKELIYESLRRGQGDIDRAGVTEIRSRIAEAGALVVADLAAVTLQTSYAANSPRCMSQPYPAFSEPKPHEPTKPNPGRRRFGIFGPRVYPKGSSDPRYRDDYARWMRDMDEYRYAVRVWENRRHEYEARRDHHDMEWQISMDAIERASISGNLRIYDLSSFGDSNTSTGKVVYSCPLKGSCERRHSCRSDRVIVRGESARPGTPDVPDMEESVSDQTVVSEAFLGACRSAVGGMLTTAILPCDRAAATQNVAAGCPGRARSVVAEATGSIRLRKEPTGEGIEVAREAALVNAYPRLVSSAREASPDTKLTDEQIRDRARVVSEEWDAKSGEYRVSVRFDSDSLAQLPAEAAR